MKKRIILVGPAGSGKDFLRKKLEAKGYKYGVSYTTRPPRIGEVDGKDYHFVSEDRFKEMVQNDEFHEYVAFNNWFYGTSKTQWFETDDVFIMTPTGISKLSEADIASSFIIYIDIPIDIRRERLALRSDADTVDRRIDADERDFATFTQFDIRIQNSNF